MNSSSPSVPFPKTFPQSPFFTIAWSVVSSRSRTFSYAFEQISILSKSTLASGYALTPSDPIHPPQFLSLHVAASLGRLSVREYIIIIHVSEFWDMILLKLSPKNRNLSITSRVDWDLWQDEIKVICKTQKLPIRNIRRRLIVQQ